MRVSAHLAAFHKAASEHHSEMLDAHQAAMAKAQDSSMTAFHKSAAASHEKMKDFHTDALEECAKTIEDSLNKIAPDGIRGIIPSAQSVVAIPRFGQRPMEKSEVSVEFEHLVSLD